MRAVFQGAITVPGRSVRHFLALNLPSESKIVSDDLQRRHVYSNFREKGQPGTVRVGFHAVGARFVALAIIRARVGVDQSLVVDFCVVFATLVREGDVFERVDVGHVVAVDFQSLASDCDVVLFVDHGLHFVLDVSAVVDVAFALVAFLHAPRFEGSGAVLFWDVFAILVPAKDVAFPPALPAALVRALRVEELKHRKTTSIIVCRSKKLVTFARKVFRYLPPVWSYLRYKKGPGAATPGLYPERRRI